MRILVIEDADSIRHMIEALVSSRGHEVEAVPTGARGIDAAMVRRPTPFSSTFTYREASMALPSASACAPPNRRGASPSS